MTQNNLHPLTEQIINSATYEHTQIKCWANNQDMNTIIVEWLEGVYEKIMHNSATRYPDGHTGPREENTHLRCNILSIPAPKPDLEDSVRNYVQESYQDFCGRGWNTRTQLELNIIIKAALDYLRKEGKLNG